MDILSMFYYENMEGNMSSGFIDLVTIGERIE